MKGFRLIGTLAVLTLALASCDSGPTGPGTLSATVSGPQALGAALVEVIGPGVRGFSDQGGCRSFGAEVSSATGTHRVLVVCSSGGTLQLGIDVDDVSAEPPTATVLQSASPANVVILSSQVVVEILEP